MRHIVIFGLGGPKALDALTYIHTAITLLYNIICTQMVLFFTNKIENGIALFDGEECQHINQSLRKKEGDHIHFLDGQGGIYKGTIESMAKRLVKVEVIEHQQQDPVSPYLHIAIAPTKNLDRIEFFLEKAIEMGVSEISFIQCKHSERKQIKLDRLNRIALAACKQSMKATFPIINDILSLDHWLKLPTNADQKMIACLTGDTIPFAQAYQQNNSCTLLIGPEGGFRESEIRTCIENRFSPVSLGKYRLRTETAGIMAVAAMRNMNEK